MILSRLRRHISDRNPNAIAPEWHLHVLHERTFHRYITHCIMDMWRIHDGNGVHEMNMQGFLNKQAMIVIESYDV